MNLIRQLQEIVGATRVAVDDDAMAPHLVDWRGRYRGRARAVVFPGTTAEVAAVVRTCRDARVAIVPQGGNTGLVGGATPDVQGNAVVVSTRRLGRVLAIDPVNHTISVEAGCLLATVQDAARQAGRLFPLSLAAEGSCTIGGNLSTNAGGVQVLRYGNTRDLTLGLEVVLPSGEIWNGMRGLRKDNTGYDLKHLFIGAEGTLGLITAAVLKLFPRPAAQATGWLAVPDPRAAVDLLAAMQARFDARLSAFELISRPTLDLVLRHLPGAADPLPAASPWQVLAELSDGGSAGELAAAFADFIGEALESGRVTDGVLAQSETQAARLWALRENASEAQRLEGISIKHDIAVPVSAIPEFLATADAALRAEFPELRIVTFGHVGDGNLHYNLSQAERQANADFIALQPRVNEIVHDIVHRLSGSISAEHGLGQLKRDEIRRYKPAIELEMMLTVKRAFDPLNLMNPGKVTGGSGMA